MGGTLKNCQAVRVDAIPVLEFERFRSRILSDVAGGGRIASFFGMPAADGCVRLCAVLVFEQEGKISVFCAECKGTYRALTPECPQAHGFEREVWEQWGIVPEGHPWLKPIRFHRPQGAPEKGTGNVLRPGSTDYFRVEGEEIHEVAVGPVHAGIIEPGHFRFQCHGEDVLHLEISLGYQHRGVERAMIQGPAKRRIHYVETLAGDMTVGHTLAYCQVVEALAGLKVSMRSGLLRSIALELERLANHVGDLGALANDVAYLPTAAYCGRLRGDFLNMTALLCGNRFGRGLLKPGGIAWDVDKKILEELSQRLSAARDVESAVDLLWERLSVAARFEGTGSLTTSMCETLGIVGIPARACGIQRDVRFNFPSGAYRFFQVPVATWASGDVFARAYVRWMEIQNSLHFTQELIRAVVAMESKEKESVPVLLPGRVAVSLVEGWRGESCHVGVTDDQGNLVHYKIVDPSFHNWFGLAMALRGQQISDFPLCNKSFNLSYCGHDL